MLSWMYITNNSDIARAAYDAGVNRIFVDLEIHGKEERQGHIDTVISGHSIDDVIKVRGAVPRAELMVRINPFHSGTEEEVNAAIDAGADLIMLPMFRTASEVEELCLMANGRAGIVPLLETKESLEVADTIACFNGVVELYVGLNDLHMDLGMNFIFEPLAQGLVDPVAKTAKARGLRFGFGGIARVGEGMVPAETVLREHARLGSDSAILSRTFYRAEESSLSNSDPGPVFMAEIEKLRKVEKEAGSRSQEEIETDRQKFSELVLSVVDRKRISP